MSSEKRPWYKWFPKDFVSDEKVKSLGPISELVYRRLLDTMWQSSACVLLNDCSRLANIAGSGLTKEQFEIAWSEIQTPGYELFKISDDERFIYSPRMLKQVEEIEIKAKAGSLGGKKRHQAKSKQNPSKIQAKSKDTDTDKDTDKDNKKNKQKNLHKESTQSIFNHYLQTVNPPKAHIKKTPALNNISKWEKEYSKSDLMSAADNYNKVKNPEFIKGPSNFYGVAKESAGFFKDYLPGEFEETHHIETDVCQYQEYDHEEYLRNSIGTTQ